MNLINGLKYNLRGLGFGLKTPKLLLLGLIRFAVVLAITAITASVILVYHQELLNVIWTKPESRWVVWVWYLLSWLLSMVLVGLSVVVSYLVAQIIFSVLIMDLMSRITEKIITGGTHEPVNIPWWQQFLFLIKQEIPRAIVPLFLTLVLTLLGWLTPLGPVVTIFTSAAAVIFLAWDNTDLIPARRLLTFKERFRILMNTLPFHLGFGILFLIPLLNILLLSFAPVGATIYYIEKNRNHPSGKSALREKTLSIG